MKNTIKNKSKIALKIPKSRTFLFAAIIWLMFVFATRIFSDFISAVSSKILSLIQDILGIGLYVMPLVFLFIMIYTFYQIIRIGLSNLRNCDDDLFSHIDEFSALSEEEGLTKLRVINFYYRSKGEVDNLIEKRKLFRLFARRDFLQTRAHLFDDLITFFYSLIISIIASIMFNEMEKSTIVSIINVLLTIICFFVVVLLKYVKRGQDGSYSYQVEEYELSLLNKKIELLENSLILSQADFDVIKTKHTVISTLKRLRKKTRSRKKRRDFSDAIDQVEGLNLSLDNYSNYVKEKYNIDGKEIFMYYRINNNTKEKRLCATGEYKCLEKIIKHYNLIENNNSK